MSLLVPPHLLFVRQMSCGLLPGWSGQGDHSAVCFWGDAAVLGSNDSAGKARIWGIVGLDQAASIWMLPPSGAVGSSECPCLMALIPAGD